MSEHNHAEFMPWCYRCDIGLDEYTRDLDEQIEEASQMRDWTMVNYLEAERTRVLAQIDQAGS